MLIKPVATLLTPNDALPREQMMMNTVVPPKQIDFKKGEACLTVTWKNGQSSTISGSELRRYCACSECRARNLVGLSLINVSSELVKVSLMGQHALNVSFSDGHERGIYPWPFLYAIAQGRGMDYLRE